MAIAICTAKCQSLGYTLAGLELSSESSRPVVGSELSWELGWNETRRREKDRKLTHRFAFFLPSSFAAQCMCSSSLGSSASQVLASECSSTCAGEFELPAFPRSQPKKERESSRLIVAFHHLAGSPSTSCGGFYRLNLYSFDSVSADYITLFASELLADLSPFPRRSPCVKTTSFPRA